MFWDNENDSERRQRWKNGLLLKWWVKNDTRDAAMPWVMLAVLVLLGLALLARVFGTRG